jgi:hypothetical protein
MAVNDHPPASRFRRACMQLDCHRRRYFWLAVGVAVSIAWAIIAWVWLS